MGVIAFVAIAAAAGWNYQQNTNEVQLSDLALENAEALARGESGTDYCDDFTTMRCMTSRNCLDGYVSYLVIK
ncbi:MAG: NVEALA domain-containing protein [Parabacteroides merdae]